MKVDMIKNKIKKQKKQKESDKMTIVVKKVPKCLRGIVKLLFGIKDK